MNDLLVLGPVGSAALIVFAILAALKAGLGSWWNERANGIGGLGFSILVAELLAVKGPDHSLEAFLDAVVTGFIVSLAVQYGHDRLEAVLKTRIEAQIDAQIKAIAEGGKKG